MQGVHYVHGLTCVLLPQSLVMGRKLVAQKYIQGWFMLDLVSSFPIDLVLFGKRSDLWRLPRLLKVMSRHTFWVVLPSLVIMRVFDLPV